MMKKKKVEGYTVQEERYTLDGWNLDNDDYAFTSNLLKILEKKITCPLLQSPQKLPKIIHISDSNHKASLISRCQIEQSNQKYRLLPINSEKNLPKSMIPKQQPSSTKIIQHIDRQSIKIQPFNKPIKVKTEGNYNLAFKPFMTKNLFSKEKFQKVQKHTKRSQDEWIAKHKRSKLLEPAKTNVCEPIFLKKQSDEKKIQAKVEKSDNSTENIRSRKNQLSLLEEKISITKKLKCQAHQDPITKMIQMQKMLGGQSRVAQINKNKKIKTEYFHDDHMQKKINYNNK